MVNVILANVGTVVCFRTGNPQDERILLPMFSPFIDAGEISNLPAFNFYAKLSAVHAQEPLSGQTLLLDDDGDIEVVRSVIDHSRSEFATKHEEEVVEQVKEETSSEDTPKAAKKQMRKTAQKTKVQQKAPTKGAGSKTMPPGY